MLDQILIHAHQEQSFCNPNFPLQLPWLMNKLIKLSLVTQHQHNGKPTGLMDGFPLGSSDFKENSSKFIFQF